MARDHLIRHPSLQASSSAAAEEGPAANEGPATPSTGSAFTQVVEALRASTTLEIETFDTGNTLKFHTRENFQPSPQQKIIRDEIDTERHQM